MEFADLQFDLPLRSRLYQIFDQSFRMRFEPEMKSRQQYYKYPEDDTGDPEQLLCQTFCRQGAE